MAQQVVFTYPVAGHTPGKPVTLSAQEADKWVRSGVAHWHVPHPAQAAPASAAVQVRGEHGPELELPAADKPARVRKASAKKDEDTGE